MLKMTSESFIHALLLVLGIFLKISVLQANFCWLGHLGKMIRPWKESVAGKETVQGVGGNLLSGVPAMWYLFAV